jgi:hypothetical protein
MNNTEKSLASTHLHGLSVLILDGVLEGEPLTVSESYASVRALRNSPLCPRPLIEIQLHSWTHWRCWPMCRRT